MGKLKKFMAKACALFLLCTCIRGLFISDVLADSSQNLISNGNFENTSDSSWKSDNDSGKANISLDSTVFHGSTGHAEKIQGSNATGMMAEKISVKPGKEYFIDAWVKGNNVTANTTDTNNLYSGQVIIVQQVDKNGNTISRALTFTSKIGTYDWKETGVSLVTANNADCIVVIVGLYGSGTCWFDDISLVENSSNSGIIPNGGFEKTTDDSWTLFQQGNAANVSLDDKVFHGASGHSKKITGSGVQSILEREFTIESGKQYTFSFWAKGENIVQDSSKIGAFISVIQLDKDGKSIDNTEQDFGQDGSFDWQQGNVNITGASNVCTVQVVLGLFGSGTAWYDDLSLIESSGSSTQLNSNIKRLSGTDRIETSLNIAKEEFSDKAPDAVILTTANNFPDALSGANLAYKNNAPILLVNKTVNDSKSTLDYVKSILAKGKDVYLLGGTGAVSSEIENYIKDNGYVVHRLQGNNRYETNQSIFDSLSVAKGTPVIICTGESFADALSVSSIAAAKGYPILLNGKDALLTNVKDDLAKIQPSTVYIIGGTGVISDKVSSQIEQITNKAPVRIGGSDRYDTSIKIIEAFNLTSDTITVATGENFPDALTGSLFAAKKGSGILLINDNVTTSQRNVIKNHNIKNIYVFGGEGVLKNNTVNALEQ